MNDVLSIARGVGTGAPAAAATHKLETALQMSLLIAHTVWMLITSHQ